MEITILASGSAGNAVLLRSDSAAVLVDAGLSARKLCKLLESVGCPAASLTAILLTHEHGDHARGLKVLAPKANVPVYATPLTADSLRRSGVEARWVLFSSGSRFLLGDFEVLPFSVPHDAADPVGFVMRTGDRAFGVLTDLGYGTRQVIESVRGVEALLIETNHDEDLLNRDPKRPWSVKQRILSRHGHLSNAAAAELVAQIATERLRHVVLGHLSRDCNSTDLATLAVRHRLTGRDDIQIHCAPNDEAADPLRLVI